MREIPDQRYIKSTSNHELFWCIKYKDVCMQVKDEGKINPGSSNKIRSMIPLPYPAKLPICRNKFAFMALMATPSNKKHHHLNPMLPFPHLVLEQKVLKISFSGLYSMAKLNGIVCIPTKIAPWKLYVSTIPSWNHSWTGLQSFSIFHFALCS